MKFTFPKDFLFGAASSAVQIESAPCDDGKGVDAWQHYSKVFPETRARRANTKTSSAFSFPLEEMFSIWTAE